MSRQNYGLGYKLVIDLPEYHLKKGAKFHWNRLEQSYTTPDLPWMLTPMVEWWQIKNTKIFKKITDPKLTDKRG